MSSIVRAAAFLALSSAVLQAGGLSKELFAFDNGTGRDQELPLEVQAAILARAGYSGMGMFTGTRRIPEVLAALDRHKLRLLSIYVHSFVDDSGPPIEPGLAEAIRQLAGRETMIFLTVRGHGPYAEEKAVANVQKVADMAAASGLRVCLYPHFNFYMETVPDALRIIRKANRKNVGVAFHLYHTMIFHWTRCGGDEEGLDPMLREALPYIFMASVNGIDRKGPDAKIVRLDQGGYDIRWFLKLLDRVGYKGPIALQGFAIPGDVEENLTRSMAAWKKLIAAY